MAGGDPGAPGANRVKRADGHVEVLDHIDCTDMAVGDVFVVETPGGGGFGNNSALAGISDPPGQDPQGA